MISDVLFDAVVQIEEYESRHAPYAEIAREIAHVKATMRALQAKLDDPRGASPIEWPEPPK